MRTAGSSTWATRATPGTRNARCCSASTRRSAASGGCSSSTCARDTSSRASGSAPRSTSRVRRPRLQPERPRPRRPADSRRTPPHRLSCPLAPLAPRPPTPPSHAALPRCPPTPRRRRGAERGSRRARGGRGGGHRGVFTRRGGIDLLHALPRQQSQLWEACSGVYAAAAKQARGAAVGGAPLALPALSLPAGRRGRGRAAVHTDGLLSAAPLGAAIRSEHDLAGEPHTPPHTSYRAVAHLPIGRSRARPLAAQVSRLDFASSDEREHFLSFVQALLPPSVLVTGRQEGTPRALLALNSAEHLEHYLAPPDGATSPWTSAAARRRGRRRPRLACRRRAAQRPLARHRAASERLELAARLR